MFHVEREILVFIYVPRGTYSKCGMNKSPFIQDVGSFREMFIYFNNIIHEMPL